MLLTILGLEDAEFLIQCDVMRCYYA